MTYFHWLRNRLKDDVHSIVEAVTDPIWETLFGVFICIASFFVGTGMLIIEGEVLLAVLGYISCFIGYLIATHAYYRVNKEESIFERANKRR